MNIHPKVSAAGIAGAVSIILVFMLDQLGIKLPVEVGSAITTILSFVVGYMTPAE